MPMTYEVIMYWEHWSVVPYLRQEIRANTSTSMSAQLEF
jgi:hypothetical protein